MSAKPTPTPASVALRQLEKLVEQLGTEMVAQVIDAIASPDMGIQLIDELDNLAGGIVRAVLDVIEPAAAKQAIAAAYTAVEAAADAAETAKFGPK